MLCIGPFRHASVDSAVHGPVRLGVLNALQTQGALDFTTLRKRLEVADGALGLRKLDEIGYVKCRKAFVGKRPKSTYAITAKGRRALGNCLATMQQLIDSMEALNNVGKSRLLFGKTLAFVLNHRPLSKRQVIEE